MLKKMRLGGVLLASLLAVTSCQNEEIASNEQQKSNYSLKVSGLVDSRTYVEEDGTVKWSEDDKLYVYGEGVSGVLTLDNASIEDGDATTGTFTGFVFGNPDNLEWAVFGNDVKSTTDGAQFTISEISDPNSNSPMVGKIEGGNVEMKHLCGMVRLTINNLPNNAIVKLKGNDIAGTAEVKDGILSTNASYKDEIAIKVANNNQTIEVPVFATEEQELKHFTLEIDNTTFEFSTWIAVGKLKQMELTCNVTDGKVTGFYKEYVKKLNIAHTTSSYISISTGADFLPIVAVNPEITGYSVFDGDTRITDAVYFRFSDVKKETISKNSYKVSVNLAIKDDKGNDLDLKSGMPSTINGKEYLHVYMNLIEVPTGYSISEVKVNNTNLTSTNNSSGNPANGEYWIGYDAKDLYFQSTTAGLIEVTVTKN